MICRMIMARAVRAVYTTTEWPPGRGHPLRKDSYDAALAEDPRRT